MTMENEQEKNQNTNVTMENMQLPEIKLKSLEADEPMEVILVVEEIDEREGKKGMKQVR